jgi:tetratricopeptide (TPR) repeat protein
MAVDSDTENESDQATPTHYQESVRLLRELHSLMAQGNSETDEADRVRDLMDDHWYQMSPVQIRRVEGLSADLYTLTDLLPPPQQLTQQAIDEFQHLSSTAVRNEDWERLLELLRDRGLPYPPDRVAFLRARCWENLGDLETALLFLEKALALSPDDAEYRLALMRIRSRLGCSTDGIAREERIIDHGGSAPLDLV